LRDGRRAPSGNGLTRSSIDFLLRMTEPLIPAILAFRDNGTPFSPRHDDIYHSAVGGLAQAQYVFLQGNGLPERWQGRRVFTVLETGFGIGINFLMTWAAWRADPARCERLHFVSTEKHPFTRDDLLSAYAATVADASIAGLGQTLAEAWPMLVPGSHRLEFEGGRVTLTLVFGDAAETLPTLWLRADAFYLDGFAPAKNPELWTPAIFKTLARLAGDDATFSTYTSAGDVKRALTQSGFEYRKVEGFGWKRAMLVGRFAPRWRVRRHEPPAPLAVQERHAVVIGTGLAGCAVIERLAARGWRVTSLERHAALARDASGNPAGVFHPMLWRDDGVASRITRAGFLYALRRWTMLEEAGHRLVRGSEGLLQLASTEEESNMMAAALASFGYPSEYVTLLERAEAERIAKLPLAQGGWLFPHGGWIDPATLCAAQCAAAGERLERRFGVEAARVERVGDEWNVFDAEGHLLARASAVIFANAHEAARVAGLRYAPTRSVRGQLTLLPAGSVPSLASLPLPVIGDGYAVPLPDGVTLTGATYDIDDPERAVQTAGHVENLQRLAQMLPTLAGTLDAQDAASLPGRVAFRCVTSDRLPMIGALADEAAAIHDSERLRGAWPLDLPRTDGLYGAFAYGSRGLVWAALGAELIASQIEGEPWPIQRDLAEDLDPARFLLRALRQGTAR
jgi:tRNA 5-methylaminomethyl-2-thiouridine biosynthesis bifunctional protein